jgi:cytochrome c
VKALVLLGASALMACAAAAMETKTAAPGAGERAFQKCYSCHSIEPEQTTLAGPNLEGIIGRPIAAQAGFDYSPALRRFAGREPVWTSALLDRYIADPEALVPGTSMAFNGIADPAERAALIGYLGQTRASAASLP